MKALLRHNHDEQVSFKLRCFDDFYRVPFLTVVSKSINKSINTAVRVGCG